jgi:hypothetical protein
VHVIFRLHRNITPSPSVVAGGFIDYSTARRIKDAGSSNKAKQNIEPLLSAADEDWSVVSANWP